MSKRVVYTGEFPDGSKLMIERWLDDDDREVSVTAATKPAPQADNWGVRVWSPPVVLDRES